MTSYKPVRCRSSRGDNIAKPSVEICQDVSLTRQLGARALSVGTRHPGVPPVLLLHGFTDSADTWRPVLAALAAEPIYAIAVDLPQFGTSERSPGADFVSDHDFFIAQAINSLDDGAGVLVVGNSFGGWGAIRAGICNPAVKGVIAISPAGFPTRGLVGNQLARSLIDLLASGPAPALGRRRSSAPAKITAILLGRAYARVGSTQPVDGELIYHYRSHIRRGDLRHWLTLASVMLKEITAPRALDLAQLSTPLHLIWGDRDPLVTVSGADSAYKQNPDMVTVDILRDVGHCAQFQDPSFVAHAISQMHKLSRDRGECTDA